MEYMSAKCCSDLPSGVLLSKEEVDRLSNMCGAAGVWLVMDNTYELFVYDGRKHYCASGSHVIHIFSFSKVSNALDVAEPYGLSQQG